MTRADWLNAVQASLVGLQSINLTLMMYHGNVYVTAVVGALITSGTMFVHLMGMKEPAPGQLGPNQAIVAANTLSVPPKP